MRKITESTKDGIRRITLLFTDEELKVIEKALREYIHTGVGHGNPEYEYMAEKLLLNFIRESLK